MHQQNRVTVGKVSTAYGVKGWVNVFSYTDPPENLLSYRDWVLVHRDGREQVLKVVDGKTHRNAYVVQFEGIDDREQARTLTNAMVQVTSSALPSLADGEFYWHQLEGLEVTVSGQGDSPRKVGRVSYLFETGANDVMVVELYETVVDDQVAGNKRSSREWLVPFLPDRVVKSVDLDAGEIEVDWWIDSD